MSELLERVSEAMTAAGLKWLADQGPGAEWGPWGEIPTEVFARAGIKVMMADVMADYLGSQFINLYYAWDSGRDVEAAFRAVPEDAAEAVKQHFELIDMCSGEMFGHKEPSNGK